jgi:hypothetical protein
VTDTRVPYLPDDEWPESMRGDEWQSHANGHSRHPVHNHSGAPGIEKPAGDYTLPIMTAGELMDTYPTLRPPLIEGLLRLGETMNIIAAPKIGKSWLTQCLAFAVATGHPWLDTFQTTQGQVLLIDNELHPQTSAGRLRRLAEASDIDRAEIEDTVSIVNLRGRLKDLPRLGAGLMKIEHGRFALVIIDAFYRALPFNTNENDNATMAQLYNLLDSYADSMGAAFALVHHASKGDQSAKSVTDVGSGAGAQSRATDTHLVLRPHEEENAVVLDAAVRSWPPLAPCCLRWSFPLWSPATDLDPTALRKPGGKRVVASAAEQSHEEEPWTAKRFAEALGRPEPQSELVLLEDARTILKLSDRLAKCLLQTALAKELLFRWREGGSWLVASVRPPAEKPKRSAPARRRGRPQDSARKNREKK